MRTQSKSISAFAANPLRARIMVREFERKCLEKKPILSGEKFDRYNHLNEFTSCYKNPKKRFDLPRRAFFRWRKGDALPNSTTRSLVDGLFDEKIGSKWGERCIDEPEQTFLVALDLISHSSHPDCPEVLQEAEEILSSINSAVSILIPKIPNLERPKFTTYKGSKKLVPSIKRKPNRYSEWLKQRPVAYPFITERINPYDSISPLCALLMYVLKPNNKSKLSDDAAKMLLLDFISGVVSAYIIMLHRNPAEFQVGGLVVDLYRLIYRLFLSPASTTDAKEESLTGEVIYNHFSELQISSEELKINFNRLVELFDDITAKAGLTATEFIEIIDPVDPDRSKDVIKWWNGKCLGK